MKNYLKNWTIMRFLRLLLGVVIIVQGVQDAQWMLVALGTIFSLMPLFNISICAIGGCEVPQQRPKRRITDTVNYEEVK